jgi:hypothetical protein
MTKPTPCDWYGLPALPLNETTLNEEWEDGTCSLHVFGPLGLLSVELIHREEGIFASRERYEVEVRLSPSCELLHEKLPRGEYFNDDMPAEVLFTLQEELRKMGYCPDGPVEFASKATGKALDLAARWARENREDFDEAEEVFSMLREEECDVEPSDPWNPSYEPMRLASMLRADDADDNQPLGLKARLAS